MTAGRESIPANVGIGCAYPVAQHRSYVSDTTSRPPAAQQFL